MNKLLLKFWYWWYVVLSSTEWDPKSDKVYQQTGHLSNAHPTVITRWGLFIVRLHNTWRDIKRYEEWSWLPRSFALWLFFHNPFQVYRLQVYYNAEFYNELDAILDNAVGDTTAASGMGCSRDVEYILSKKQLKAAMVKLLELQTLHPEWELSILNEIDDADFMGVGY